MPRVESPKLPEKNSASFQACIIEKHGAIFKRNESGCIFCTLYSTLYTVHSTLYTPHSTLCTLHSTLYTLHSTLYTLHSTLYTVYLTLKFYRQLRKSWPVSGVMYLSMLLGEQLCSMTNRRKRSRLRSF